jgi:phosphonate transport system substrate-binding protein
VTLRFLVPPSVGTARAQARGELLERALSNDMGEAVAVEVAASYDALERGAGGAELVWAPAAVCAAIEHEARAIFKVVRGGRSTYRGALVGRRDARLTLQQLAGKRAAWVDRRSFGGYLLALHHLKERGIDPARTFASQAFLGTHPAALTAVLEGRADVASVSIAGGSEQHVEEALALHAGRAGARDLVALAITETAPTDALLFTTALDAGRAQALIERVFPAGEPSRQARSLCLAMEAERFERARSGEYACLRPLLLYAAR